MAAMDKFSLYRPIILIDDLAHALWTMNILEFICFKEPYFNDTIKRNQLNNFT